MNARFHPALAAALRFILGGIWLAGAIFNLLRTLPHPETLTADLGTTATFAPYRWLFADLVGASPTAWIVALVAGEAALAVLLFSHGMLARIGVIGSIAWSVFLFFSILPYTLMMAGFAALGVWLLDEQQPESLPAFLRGLHLPHHEGGTA
jgi:hypothetical protein